MYEGCQSSVSWRPDFACQDHTFPIVFWPSTLGRFSVRQNVSACQFGRFSHTGDSACVYTAKCFSVCFIRDDVDAFPAGPHSRLFESSEGDSGQEEGAQTGQGRHEAFCAQRALAESASKSKRRWCQSRWVLPSRVSKQQNECPFTISFCACSRFCTCFFAQITPSFETAGSPCVQSYSTCLFLALSQWELLVQF